MAALLPERAARGRAESLVAPCIWPEALRGRAEAGRVLCGKYSSTLRKVQFCTPQGVYPPCGFGRRSSEDARPRMKPKPGLPGKRHAGPGLPHEAGKGFKKRDAPAGASLFLFISVLPAQDYPSAARWITSSGGARVPRPFALHHTLR